MRCIVRFLALLACAALVPCALSAQPLNFRFDLDNDYSTSAGAFDSSGALVRTLWSNRRYVAGSHEAAWDGRDDDGRAVPGDADYEIRLLTHNVIYTWDGVIGNTSPDPTSPLHHDSVYFFNDMAVSGDRVFYTAVYEGRTVSMRYFRLDDPQSWHARPALPMAYDATMGMVTADRERVYWAHDSSGWAHTWGNGGDQAFVMATDRDLSREIVFEAGTATCVMRRGAQCYRDGEMDANIRSAIDIVREFPEDPKTKVFEGARNDVTGLAVQVDGPLLFAAHGALSLPGIHVLDKRSGRLLARVPLAGVGRLVAVPGRDELWAIHDGAGGRVVSHLAIGPAPDYALKITRTLKGVEAPLALSLSADGKQIVVAEGGASQRVRAFDASSGEPVWQLGEKGGYAVNGPAVTAEKFSFYRKSVDPQTSERPQHALLGFAPDGSMWVGDTGLFRLLKFDGNRRNVDQIAFLPGVYNAVADRNDPSRVFMEYTEYAADYTKPIQRGWKLVRYFRDSPQLTLDHRQFTTGFIDVATLRNGRTYGLARTGRGAVDVMEIPREGDLRRFPLKLQGPAFLKANGDLYSARVNDANGRMEVWQRALTGFDNDGQPLWGREETRARVTRAGRDPRPAVVPGYERGVALLDPDVNVVFEPYNSEAGRFHLGAFRNGASQWLWRASPANGEFDLAQPDGVFDNSRPWYAGMVVSAIGDQLVYNYHGEGWHNGGQSVGQANQFLHWYRDGLFVGQFGVPLIRDLPPGTPGMAGNSFSIQLVAANGQTYLWHNDESAHAGIHRWHLDGVEWMRESKGRGRLGQSIELARDSGVTSPERPTPSSLADSRGSATASGLRVPTGLTALAGLAPPSDLAARAQPRGVRLTWNAPAGADRDERDIAARRSPTAFEVQRLQPTYIGPRFERIATVARDATSFVDDKPLYGEPTVYRVRAVFEGGGTSDYSNHVHITAPSKSVLLESQNFESTQDARDEFRPKPTPDVTVDVIPDPANPRNKVMHVRARRPAGTKGEFWARPLWTASRRLFDALNVSVGGRARGSTPDLYRVQFKVRVLDSHLSAGSSVAVQVDLGYNMFSTPGRRQDLLALTGAKTEQVSFDFAALPNGEGAHGLQQFRAYAPTNAMVVFPVDLRADGDFIEFLIDDLTVSRLDAPSP